MSKEIIAERLRAARENACLTQKEAADALGVTLQAISSYERAVTRVDVESLGELCRLYGVSVDSIVNGDETFASSASQTEGARTPQLQAAAAHFDLDKLTDEGREMLDDYYAYLAERFSKE